MTPYRISEEALRDIDDIWFYSFNKWSREQADRYHQLIFGEIAFLIEHFENGKDMNQIKPGYKAAKVKSHLIFYKKANDGLVEIIRVLHQRMDIKSRLK